MDKNVIHKGALRYNRLGKSIKEVNSFPLLQKGILKSHFKGLLFSLLRILFKSRSKITYTYK